MIKYKFQTLSRTKGFVVCCLLILYSSVLLQPYGALRLTFYLLTDLLSYLLTYFLTYLLTDLMTDLLTYLLTYLLTNLLS